MNIKLSNFKLRKEKITEVLMEVAKWITIVAGVITGVAVVFAVAAFVFFFVGDLALDSLQDVLKHALIR